ncbi:NAC domain-containing protein 41-like [Pistacia vera]|uniref:NAC domain-containing protein 41-like n=1 Tax=Pistacia vera TaxID=55513 RepID=UPI001263ABBE|nr:NAC domain-containing protein 41-like [Pistacia vera]
MIVPTGFRFNPTDEELIEILERKVCGKQMPLHDTFIIEKNVYDHEPEKLEWDRTMAVHKNERYYYCIRENDSREVSGRGWWKATSHVKKIYANNKCVVGYKRPLTFHRFTGNKRKRNKAIKTNWIMYEYGLESYTTEWRLCKIKYKGKQSVQEELENIRKGYGLSSDIISGERCSVMEMKSSSSSSVVFVDEEEERQPIMKSLEEVENKITSDDFISEKIQREDQEMNNEEEQQLMLYASYNYDPILTHITSSSNYDYFGDYNYNYQLEQLPYSVDELFPSFWS